MTESILNCWIKNCVFILFSVLPASIFGQTGITGSATITISEEGATCGGAGKRVHIYADVTDMEGAGGVLVGINSFVIALSIDRPAEFGVAFAGDDPPLDWGLAHTSRALVQITNTLTIAGWVPATDAPNQLYHLATLIFAGDAGPVTLIMESAELASRVVAGQDPEAINTVLPGALVVNLPVTFVLNVLEGLEFWLQPVSVYDLVTPSGVNVLDFVSVVNCGGGQ